jgi:hypothetical protein
VYLVTLQFYITRHNQMTRGGSSDWRASYARIPVLTARQTPTWTLARLALSPVIPMDRPLTVNKATR